MKRTTSRQTSCGVAGLEHGAELAQPRRILAGSCRGAVQQDHRVDVLQVGSGDGSAGNVETVEGLEHRRGLVGRVQAREQVEVLERPGRQQLLAASHFASRALDVVHLGLGFRFQQRLDVPQLSNHHNNIKTPISSNMSY